MQRPLLILIFVAFVSHSGRAQLWRLRPLEVTAAAGSTHSFTDIGRYNSGSNFLGLRDISMVNTGLAINGNVRYRFSTNFAVRSNFTYGYLHASDIHGSESARGFETFTEFFEPSLLGEFYLIKNRRENAYLFINSRRSPKYNLFAYFDLYLFAGFGGVVWDVTPNPALALYLSETRGFTAMVPAGIGIAQIFSDNFKGGIELGGRYLLKDDLEALVLPGTGNDSFYYLSLNLTWRFKTRRYPTF